MRLIRWLIAVCVAAGTVVAVPAPAHASPSCSHTIEWYHNRYEVVASDRITCTDGMREIRSDVKLRTWSPEEKVYSYYRICETARACSASSYMSNAAGTQSYCATAKAWYRRDQYDTFGTNLPELNECIYV